MRLKLLRRMLQAQRLQRAMEEKRSSYLGPSLLFDRGVASEQRKAFNRAKREKFATIGDRIE